MSMAVTGLLFHIDYNQYMYIAFKLLLISYEVKIDSRYQAVWLISNYMQLLCFVW